MSKLRFAHLSDIHLPVPRAIGTDPEDDVRNELLLDLREQVQEGGALTAVLVSGDIAFSGKHEEFSRASEYLERVCAAGRCRSTDVLLCPGNHDVDRTIIAKNSLIRDAHNAILSQPTWAAVDQALVQRIGESEAARLLYRAIDEFNTFAAGFECTFTPDRFSWDRDFELSDGSTLRLRSLNSTLTSGPQDAERRLCIGTHGWTLPREDGVEYVVMAHHPPNWVKDGNSFDSHIGQRARIHLFGHEHDQRIVSARDYVRLYAGSVNPERSEEHWRPGYNLIDVWVEGEGSQRDLIIEVRMREWARNPIKFQALRTNNGSDVDISRIRLSPWTRPSGQSPGADPEHAGEEFMQPEPPGVNVRDVTHRFFKLNFSERSAIAGGLGLFEDSDAPLPDFQRNVLALKRAREAGKWDELVSMVEATEARHDEH